VAMDKADHEHDSRGGGGQELIMKHITAHTHTPRSTVSIQHPLARHKRGSLETRATPRSYVHSTTKAEGTFCK
jgi:hypothetical protein